MRKESRKDQSSLKIASSYLLEKFLTSCLVSAKVLAFGHSKSARESNLQVVQLIRFARSLFYPAFSLLVFSLTGSRNLIGLRRVQTQVDHTHIESCCVRVSCAP